MKFELEACPDFILSQFRNSNSHEAEVEVVGYKSISTQINGVEENLDDKSSNKQPSECVIEHFESGIRYYQ